MNITAWAGSGRGDGQEMWSIVGRVSVIPANICGGKILKKKKIQNN